MLKVRYRPEADIKLVPMRMTDTSVFFSFVCYFLVGSGIKSDDSI